MRLDKVLALSGRLSMLFNAVTELEEALVSSCFGLWACAAPVVVQQHN